MQELLHEPFLVFAAHLAVAIAAAAVLLRLAWRLRPTGEAETRQRLRDAREDLATALKRAQEAALEDATTARRARLQLELAYHRQALAHADRSFELARWTMILGVGVVVLAGLIALASQYLQDPAGTELAALTRSELDLRDQQAGQRADADRDEARLAELERQTRIQRERLATIQRTQLIKEADLRGIEKEELHPPRACSEGAAVATQAAANCRRELLLAVFERVPTLQSADALQVALKILDELAPIPPDVADMAALDRAVKLAAGWDREARRVQASAFVESLKEESRQVQAKLADLEREKASTPDGAIARSELSERLTKVQAERREAAARLEHAGSRPAGSPADTVALGAAISAALLELLAGGMLLLARETRAQSLAFFEKLDPRLSAPQLAPAPAP